MHRRTFVKLGAAAAAGLFVPGCCGTSKLIGGEPDVGDQGAGGEQTRICEELFTYVEPDRPSFTCAHARTIHVLRGPKKTVMIDTGEFTDVFEKSVVPQMKRDGLNPFDICEIWNTHSHPDHVGADGFLQAATGAFIYAHPAAVRLLCDPKNNEKDMVDSLGEDCDVVTGFSAGLLRAFSGLFLKKQKLTVAGTFSDGQVLDPGFPVEVKFAPGHSPDSVAFWVPSKRILIAGDALLQEHKGHPIINTPLSNVTDMRETLEWMLGKHPAVMANGHYGTIVGEDRCDAVLRHSLQFLDDMNATALALLKSGPVSLHDLMRRYPFKEHSQWKIEARIAYWCLMKNLAQQGIAVRCPEYEGKKVVDLKWRAA
ncbi:MAG TPA: MBL fold metallo-hydrolase [Chitinivibrionales bacterium]|nr:MBL fold metallo-hydrolase [Chitinivibrionales bacterium]